LKKKGQSGIFEEGGKRLVKMFEIQREIKGGVGIDY
jgi:hypothetical protein